MQMQRVVCHLYRKQLLAQWGCDNGFVNRGTVFGKSHKMTKVYSSIWQVGHGCRPVSASAKLSDDRLSLGSHVKAPTVANKQGHSH